MQEILNAADSATYRIALERYIVDNISLEDEYELAVQAHKNEASLAILKAGNFLSNMQGLTKG